MDRAPRAQGAHLNHAAAALAAAVAALLPAAVAARWTPRELIAHLIGWNLPDLQGCPEILAGRMQHTTPTPDRTSVLAVAATGRAQHVRPRVVPRR